MLSSKVQVELNSLVHNSSVTQLTHPQIELVLLAHTTSRTQLTSPVQVELHLYTLLRISLYLSVFQLYF